MKIDQYRQELREIAETILTPVLFEPLTPELCERVLEQIQDFVDERIPEACIVSITNAQSLPVQLAFEDGIVTFTFDDQEWVEG